MRRREVLKWGLGTAVSAAARAAASGADCGPPLRLHIATLEAELARGIRTRTIAFNGQVRGPQLRLGPQPLALDVINDTDAPQVMQAAPLTELLTVPARSSRRVVLPAAVAHADARSWKHYHAACASSGTVAVGTLGVAHREPGVLDAGYDQQYVLAIHHWQPRAVLADAPFHDTVVRHGYASFDDKLLCASDPINVRVGQRVRFHFINASASRTVDLALPEHRFEIVALDGNRVPTPRSVERILLGPGESLDALVSMNRPGRWVLGASNREDRRAGLGRIVEYSGAGGTPVESALGAAPWDYAWFGTAPPQCVGARVAASSLAVQAVPDLEADDSRLLDPTPQRADRVLDATPGAPHRIAISNFTREAQAFQVVNHAVEIVGVAGHRTAGLIKDVVTIPSFTRMECEFIARSERISLLHSRRVRLKFCGAAPSNGA